MIREYAFRSLGFDFAGKHFESNQPSQEAICSYNPDVFVIGGIYQNKLVNTLKNDSVYANLDAVKNDNRMSMPAILLLMLQKQGLLFRRLKKEMDLQLL